MRLSDHALHCIHVLEQEGFEAYAVGGCVRDGYLGITPNDYDLCTNALPDQTEQIFRDHSLVLTGKKHGTVAVVFGGDTVEITTYRREGGYSDNRHPDWVDFVDRVETDLARRDFTVNAMAWSPSRGYADPFGGRQDLDAKCLRTVGDPRIRFREDSLRILRGLRFAARFGLTIEPETFAAMVELVPLTEQLAPERIFSELCGLLPLVTAADLRRFAPVLTGLIPELKPLVDFDQRSPHHAYDLYTHVAHVVESVPPDLALRWAALLHDIGKIPTATVDATGRGHYYGHAQAGAEMADTVLRRLKAPTALRTRVVALIEGHMHRLRPDRIFLKKQLRSLGREALEQSFFLQRSDMGSKGLPNREELESFSQVRTLLDQLYEENLCLQPKDLAVTGQDLMALGLQGKAIGQTLETLLELVLEEKTENTRQSLLNRVHTLSTDI